MLNVNYLLILSCSLWYFMVEYTHNKLGVTSYVAGSHQILRRIKIMPLNPRKPVVEEKAKEVKVEEAKVTETAADIEKAAVAGTTPTEVAKNDDSINGTLSATVEFVGPLGDKSRPDKTPADPTKHIAGRTDPTIVGYAFKALVDMEVPDCGEPQNLRNNPMDFEPSKMRNRRPVKAGEVFYLTRFETGVLLSPPEFNAQATGGEFPVSVVYQRSKKAPKSAAAVVTSQTAFPGISLRPMNANQGSVKDLMINVLDVQVETGADGKTTKKIRTLHPEFAPKFNSLCKVAERVAGTRTASGNSNKKYNEGAQNFMNIFNAR